MKTCIHFGTCGGCDFQNIEYSLEISKKKEYLQKTFPFLSPIEFVPSPSSEFYRNKIQMPFSSRAIQGKRVLTLGLHNLEETFIVDQQECYIQKNELTVVAQQVKKVLRKFPYKAYQPQKRTGAWRHLVARISDASKEIMIILVVNHPLHPKEIGIISKKIHEHGNGELKKLGTGYKITGILMNINSSTGKMVLSDEFETIWGKNYITEKLNGFSFQIPAGGFFQTNREITELIYAEIQTRVEKNAVVYDLFSGLGTIGTILSKKASSVLSIEENKYSHQFAFQTAKKFQKSGNQKFIQARVEEFLENREFEPNAVFIVDPPRIGLSQKTIQSILEAQPSKILYLSCDIDTLQRDAKLFSQKYKMVFAKGYDMFPRTSHFEILTEFVLK